MYQSFALNKECTLNFQTTQTCHMRTLLNKSIPKLLMYVKFTLRYFQ